MKMANISQQEVLHYLGCKKQDPDLLMEIKEMSKIVEQISKPRVSWRIFPLFNGQPAIDVHLPGKDIQRLLKESHSVIFMAATLGMNIDRELKKWEIRDMGKALVFDACANAGIEAVCDDFCEQLSKEYEKQGMYITDRFSCGYGDFPIEVQKDFIRVLDTNRKIGLFLNESYTLIPRKSVTAVIGIASVKQPAMVRGCPACSMKETCELRKGGNVCGK